MILPPVDPSVEEQQVVEKPPIRDDTHFAAGKIAVFQYVTVGIFLFLISGFWSLQVQNPQFYDERAEANRSHHQRLFFSCCQSHCLSPRAV